MSRPSEAPWRAEVLEAYGEWCRVCGGRPVQAAHIMAKSQGGETVVENGIPLCRPHHEHYDQYKMRLRYEWLTPEQRAWLEQAGYVFWDAAGEPSGRGWRRFEPMTPGQLAAREKMMNGAPS